MNRLLLTLLFLPLFTKAQIINTLVGNGTAGFSGDYGPPAAAELNSPVALCFGGFGAYGSLYVADGTNNRVRQIKLGPGGVIFTIAGTGVIGFSGDGGPAVSAELNEVAGVAALSTNIVYFSDHNNNRIRKIDMAGNISTYGGTGVAGSSGDGGPATSASINSPYDVSVDKKGNIYFAEEYGHRVRKIDTFGIITTVAGTGTSGFSGDGGPATSAEISFPNYSYVDSLGQLYFSDNGNQRIRKVDTSGIISTVAGTGGLGFTGDGGAATNAMLNYPADITVDRHGNLIISDSYNDRIRRVDATTGIITTVAGTGVAGLSGDGGPATAAMINKPHGLAVDPANNIYFIDRFNNKIRIIYAVVSASFSSTASSTCQDSCITFTSTSTGTIDSVRWEAAGATVVSPTAHNTSICFPSAGTIAVHLYVYGPGGVDSSVNNITVNSCTTGIGKVNNKTENDFWVSTGNNGTVNVYAAQLPDDDLAIAVYDVLGNKLLTDTWRKGLQSKQLAGLNNSGLYIIRLSSRNVSILLKWAKY